MPKYMFTEKAGRMAAGRNNHGVGTTVDLDEDAAAAALERGELTLVPDEEAFQIEDGQVVPDPKVIEAAKEGAEAAAAGIAEAEADIAARKVAADEAQRANAERIERESVEGSGEKNDAPEKASEKAAKASEANKGGKDTSEAAKPARAPKKAVSDEGKTDGGNA